MRQLVVTADDLGLAEGFHRGALAAAGTGIVTAVSVATVGAACDEAITALRDHPELDVGLHLTLVGERPLSPAAEIPSLVGRDGRLLPGFGAFCARFAAGRVNPGQLRLEMARQFDRLMDAGLPVWHVNSHQHLHALPAVFAEISSMAAARGIAFVRIPDDGPLPPPTSPRRAALRVLRALGRRAAGRVPATIRALDGTLGIADAGRLDRRRLERILFGHWAGRRELVCHPGQGNATLARRYPWGYDWERETAALAEQGLRERLRDAGIALTSFSRLAGAAR